MTNQLGIVYCSVDIALGGNNLLFDREKLYESLTQEATQYLGKYGINYRVEPLSGLRGWRRREFIGNPSRTMAAALDNWFFRFKY